MNILLPAGFKTAVPAIERAQTYASTARPLGSANIPFIFGSFSYAFYFSHFVLKNDGASSG